jgi:UDP-N-acetylmuramyl-tripeptide synthetase
VELLGSSGRGLELNLKYDAVPVRVVVPVLGTFQAENLAVALGLVLAAGVPWRALVTAVPKLTGVPGRMELVPTKPGQPTVLVDYAHKPDGMERVLRGLRPQVPTGGKLWVVFGCGGNRDALKRPMMGKLAAEWGDAVVVTDDNPRREEAASIRAQVLAGVGKPAGKPVFEEGDRRAALALALAEAGPQDVIAVLGKGHETGQIVGDTVLPFDDRVVLRELLG